MSLKERKATGAKRFISSVPDMVEWQCRFGEIPSEVLYLLSFMRLCHFLLYL